MKKQNSGTEKKTGIYKITSPSGKVYIGQSIDIEKRWGYYKTKKTNIQPKLQNSFNKYGVTKHLFEILELCSEDTLNERERYWQDFYNVIVDGLNLKLTPANEMGRLSPTTLEKRQTTRQQNGGYSSVQKRQLEDNVAKRPDVKHKISNTVKLLWQDPEYRARRKPIGTVTCPHCNLTGKVPIMKRWHLSNCKKAK